MCLYTCMYVCMYVYIYIYIYIYTRTHIVSKTVGAGRPRAATCITYSFRRSFVYPHRGGSVLAPSARGDLS